FANTFVALEKSGQLLDRVESAFGVMADANSDPELLNVQRIEAPKLAALNNAQMLNPKLFARVEAIYNRRDSLQLDAESGRLVARTYQRFTHEGAKLADPDRNRLKEINEQLSVLSTAFTQKLLAAAKAAAYATTDKSDLAGLRDGEIEA